MSESKRTLVFVGAALAAVGLAAGTHRAMQPVSLDQFSDVGEEFYPDFRDPNAATGLRVAAYNEDAARVDVFNVEFRDGLWRIPSHHNYPADGDERLAKTATSIIGITRDAIVSTSADDFKRLGVLDPLDESVTGTEGRGDRITLLEGDTVLADYIIGTKVEDQQNVYHVRRPDETRSYRAALDIDISTKFADWIEPGLLDVRRDDLREIVIDGYSIDETRGVLVPGEVSQLKRESSTAPWALDGIAENEKVKTSEVNSIINGLEDLKIVGVRPKPPGLSADLKGEGGTKLDTIAFLDLQRKGYFVDAQGALVSNEGEVRVGTGEGALYVLRFGEVFTGTDVDIEIGKTAEEDADKSDTGTEKADDTGSGDDQNAADDEGTADENDDSNKQSRYLFITTQFDDALIPSPGEKPVAPEAPGEETEPKPDEASDGQTSAPDENPPKDSADSDSEDGSNLEDGTRASDGSGAEDGSDASDGSAASEDPSADKANESETDADGSPADGDKAESEEGDDATKKSAADEEYQKALAEYEAKLKQWEQDQKVYEEKLDAGRKRVAELNARFADWYYVISAESFDKIRADRGDLIEVEEPADDQAGPESDGPSLGSPASEAKPGDEANSESSSSHTPPTEKPASPPTDPKTSPPPADSPPADSPADTGPATGTPDAGPPKDGPPKDETPPVDSPES